MPPSLVDVARLAGVSTFTASVALRHGTKVAPATRDRVIAAAAQLGYRPNLLVGTVMASVRQRRCQQTGNVIAFLLSREQASRPHQLDYQNVLRKGATERARHYGFRLATIPFSSVQYRGARLQQVLDSRNITGVIIPPVPAPGFRFGLSWAGLTCVAIGHSFDEVPIHRVNTSHFRCVSTALKACTDLGWSRPGLAISTRMASSRDDTLLGGYFSACYLANGEHAIPPFLYDDDDLDEAAFLNWVRAHKVGVVLTMRGSMLDSLQHAGYVIGRDIGLVLLNHGSGLSPFAGIDKRLHDLGANATELLVSTLLAGDSGPPSQPRLVEIDGIWVDGPSLPPRSPKPRPPKRRLIASDSQVQAATR